MAAGNTIWLSSSRYAMLKQIAKYSALVPAILLGCSCTQPHNTTQVKTPDGTEINVSSDTPVTYPTGMPVEQYPGSQVTVTASTDNLSSNNSTMAQLKTEDSTNVVEEFYKSKLAAAGWTLDSNMNTNGMCVMSSSKGSERLAIQVIPDPSHRATGIVLTKSQ
jgi:hypothetical protein